MTRNHEDWHQEKIDIVKAGIQSTDYQHLDDTSGRERGKNRYVNVLTNDYYSAYFTLAHKDRLSIIEMLSIDGLKFILNDQADVIMRLMNVPDKYLNQLKNCALEKLSDRKAMDLLLSNLFPNPKKNKGIRKKILEACAIAGYHQNPFFIKHLMVDDAPQFKLISQYLSLCWIHEGRHYKKMHPIFPRHQELLNTFVTDFWNYYHQLKKYKSTPSEELAHELKNEFEQLFSRKTEYDKLDKQIERTKLKVDSLLLTLKFPHLPLHNNPAELAARYQARVRDIHFHTMSAAGTKIKDALATISATSRKLSVNMFDYLFDRITKNYQMPSLATMIKNHQLQPVPDG